VALRKELEVLQQYLGIEQIRFGNRLAVQLDIAPDTLEARVPNLILQPLVENAIRHGIEPHAKPGRIRLCAQHAAGTLILEVCDNGAGLRKNGPIQEGVGLSNTRARLQTLYGGAHALQLSDAPGGGFLVRLTIPFRKADPPS
jgi:sensor histidine kinase YesM